MAKEFMKEILFHRAIPKYVINCPTDGYNIYSCKSCGDGFILESSLQEHMQRKSILITYKCRYCLSYQTFYNRCDLLSHIRTHILQKTATIYVNDISIDPLPLSFFRTSKTDSLQKLPSNLNNSPTVLNRSICPECKKDISINFKLFEDRAIHFKKFSNPGYSCPICSYDLPSACGLRAHMRIHLDLPPMYCPDCGIHLSKKMVTYPYTHGCKGFEMIKATVRIRCPVEKCNIIFHPNNYRDHMMKNHIKLIYSDHDGDINHDPLNFYVCNCSVGKYMIKSQINLHLNHHFKNQINVFPCWICFQLTFDDVMDLINHHILVHNNGIKDVFQNILKCVALKNVSNNETTEKKNLSKRKSSLTFAIKNVSRRKFVKNKYIVCPLCKYRIEESWDTIRTHFTLNHKDYRCKDARILLPKIDITKYIKS